MVLLAITASFAEKKTSRGLCVIALLVLTRSPAPRRHQPTESSSQTPRATSQWRPCPRWQVCAKLPRSSVTADVATKIIAQIMGGFAVLRVRVSCPNDPFPPLCSRPAFGKMGGFLSQREVRWLAPSSACTCDVWSSAVASCSAWQKVQTSTVSDFTTSVTQDTFHAIERFVRTCVAGSCLGISRIWKLFVANCSVSTSRAVPQRKTDLSQAAWSRTQTRSCFSRALFFVCL